MDKNIESGRNVVFESEQTGRPRPTPAQTPNMLRWLMSISGGALKNERQTSYVLAAIAAVAIVVSFYSIFSSGTKIPKEALVHPEYGLPEVD